jgi:hypothetical protein
VSRKNKNGRVRCGKCYRVLFSELRRKPRAAELATFGAHRVDDIDDEISKLVGFDQPHQDRLRQTVIYDAGDRIVGFYCPKCSIRYDPSNCEDRVAEHVRKHQDLVLTLSDIKKRRT